MPIQTILAEELANNGWNTESILLHEKEIRSCFGCFKCWDTTPGICSGVKGDDAETIKEKIIKSELVVFLTPLTFGGYSSELKKIIERMLGILQPGFTRKSGESHHLKRYERYPSLLAVATTETLDEEEIQIFNTLIQQHSLNFYPPKYRTEVFLTKDEEGKIRDRLRE
jgi:multimeric flavodoxin WrbA